MTPKEVIQFAKENNVQMVDYKFLDFVGIWQHFTTPVSELEEEVFEDGLGFDGSSIRGWQPIHNSDMAIVPDPSTAMIDPFVEMTTLSLICNIYDPITKEGYSRDPRYIAQKAEAYLKSTGIGDTAFVGPEPEFFVFEDVRYASSCNQSFYSVDTTEGIWNTGREEYPNLGYKPRHKEGYFPCAPTDSLVDLRNEMVQVLQSVGMHHEAGQDEMGIQLLNVMSAQSQDPRIQEVFAKRKAALGGSYKIGQAVKQFQSQHQRAPSSLEELKTSGFLKSIPKDPYGGQFYLAPNGRVKTTSNLAESKPKG